MEKKGADNVDSNDEHNRCPTCGQSQSGSNNSNEPLLVRELIRLDQITSVETFDETSTDDDEDNVTANELTGDPDREQNDDTEMVYIEYDIEPGQLIFIDSITSASSILEEGNVDSPSPAIFIGGEGPDNSLLQVVNLDTQEQEIIDVERLLIPVSLMHVIAQSPITNNENEGGNDNENDTRDQNDSTNS